MSTLSTRSLAGRTIVGFVQLIVLLMILLFGPAWTTRYWQAWIYLSVFSASTAMITAYLWWKDPKLLERRVNAGPRAETEKYQKVIQLFASLSFIGVLLLPSLDHRFFWSKVPLGAAVAGDFLVALGFLTVYVVFKQNTYTSATIEVVTGQQVVSTGPYAIVRHPMYTGALVVLFGTPLALGSWWGLLMIIPMAIVISLRLLDEEKFLSGSLPGYRDYCRRVKFRLVPYVW
jgi:protein-S-isoprenylcysteine O-methyltransferase Ste14